MNSIDEFTKDMQPVNQEEQEDTMDREQYYYEELVTFMQALPKKAIFETYK